MRRPTFLLPLAALLLGCAARPAPAVIDGDSAAESPQATGDDGTDAPDEAALDEPSRDAHEAGGEPAPHGGSGAASATPDGTTGSASRADVGPDDAALRRAFAQARPIGTLRGRATYYSDALAGRLTASGEPYRPAGFTAAHRSLPFGTVLRVRRVGKPADVYVRVTDRGPFGKRGLIVDLSRAAAARIDLVRPGIADVVVEILRLGPRDKATNRSRSRGSR